MRPIFSSALSNIAIEGNDITVQKLGLQNIVRDKTVSMADLSDCIIRFGSLDAIMHTQIYAKECLSYFVDQSLLPNARHTLAVKR